MNDNQTSAPTRSKAQIAFDDAVAAMYNKATAADKSNAKKIANGTDPRFETISAVEAAVLVTEYNAKNRDLSIAKVYGYRDAMNRGEWQVNHQGLAFYGDGIIADGQHRLFALTVSSLGEQVFMVTPNFSENAIHTIDVAKARNAGDALQLLGVTDAKIKATIAKSAMPVIHMIEEGTIMRNITVKQVEDFVNANAELFDWAVNIGRETHRGVSDPCLSERDAAEVCLLLSLGGYPKGWTMSFIAALQQGLAPYANAPHLYLARRLARAKLSEKNKDKLTSKEKRALLLKGAYLAATEQGVAKVAWNPRKEAFPTNKPPSMVDFEEVEAA